MKNNIQRIKENLSKYNIKIPKLDTAIQMYLEVAEHKISKIHQDSFDSETTMLFDEQNSTIKIEKKFMYPTFTKTILVRELEQDVLSIKQTTVRCEKTLIDSEIILKEGKRLDQYTLVYKDDVYHVDQDKNTYLNNTPTNIQAISLIGIKSQIENSLIGYTSTCVKPKKLDKVIK